MSPVNIILVFRSVGFFPSITIPKSAENILQYTFEHLWSPAAITTRDKRPEPPPAI